jgi:hypothetical protein
MANKCRDCVYFFIESEGFEYKQFDYPDCRKRPNMMWLKSFPFKDTKCKSFRAKEPT